MVLFWDIFSVFASVVLNDRAAGLNLAQSAGLEVSMDVDYYSFSKLIPPELMCRKGKYIIRTIFYKNIFQMPTEDTQLFFTMENSQMPPEYVISKKCDNDVSLNEVDIVLDRDIGMDCFRDGLRFWYSELDRTIQTRYTFVNIPGITFTGDVGRSLIAYALVTPGLIDLLGHPSSLEDNDCVEVTESTSQCYRSTGRKCDKASRCSVDVNWRLGCQCYSGFEKKSPSAPCMDIDECQSSVCQGNDTTCVNLPGSYHCEKLITSSPPLPQVLSCADDELDQRTYGSTVCTPKRVITPSELTCAINRATAVKFLFPVGEPPGTLVMADADVQVDIVSKQTVNNKDRWTEQTFSLTCSSEPFTKMGPVLLDNVRTYGVTSEVDVPDDLAYYILHHVKKYTETVGGVNAECYSNGVLVWSIREAQIYFIKVTSDNLIPGNINTTLKYSLTGDPRTVSQFTCKKFGMADDCYWASSQHECGKDKVCNVTGQADDHFSVGCVCKPGFVGEGGGAPCSDTTLCIPGLKVEQHKCVDVDECADDTATCVEGDDCKNVLGGYECRDREDCSYGTEYINATCEDIDECALRTDTCDPGSTNCVNIRGGFKCECKNPTLQLGPSLTTCIEPQYEFRLLDYNKFRCCSHRDGSGAGSAYLVRGRKGGFHNGYSEISPVACIRVADVDLSHVPWAYTKPYILSGTGDLEVEHLLLLVDAVREGKREPEAIAELLYSGRCRHAFSLGSGHDASHTPHKYYISYTSPSHNYFHPHDSSFSRCRRSLGTNVEWLSQNPHTPKPAVAPNVSCHLFNNSGEGRIAPLLVSTTIVLALFRAM